MARPSPGNEEREAFPGEEVAPLLLDWYEKSRRSLPWREAPGPYATWVSEVMLQQTQVETVLGHYRRFLDRFPTLEALAAAELDGVLAAWSGLGYYRRARSLHAGVKAVLKEHGGEFPRRLEDAVRLPGVGLYTAGAVLSIAYNLPVPAVDGNVERVVTRLLRLGGNPKQAPRARELRAVVARWMPAGSASRFNQALMELGAVVCRPRAALCDRCPLGAICLARRHGDVDRYPESPRAQKTVAVTLHAAVVQSRGRYLLERVTRGSFLKGLWLFPFVETPVSLVHTLEEKLGVRCSLVRPLGRIRHSITYRRISVEAFLLKPEGVMNLDGKHDFRWARIDDFGSTVPVSSLAFKIAVKLSQSQDPGSHFS